MPLLISGFKNDTVSRFFLDCATEYRTVRLTDFRIERRTYDCVGVFEIETCISTNTTNVRREERRLTAVLYLELRT